jgi:hypothetical protein
MHFVATKRLLLAALSYAREQERRIELLVTEIDKQQDDIARLATLYDLKSRSWRLSLFWCHGYMQGALTLG